MGRDVKLINYFPDFMRISEPGKTLAFICRQLGNRLDESERLSRENLRAHRIKQAPQEIDLLRLAALFGLQAADYALARKFYQEGVFGARDEAGYQEYINVLRNLIERTIKVFGDGCGTLWALLEGTSILLGAETLYDEQGKPIVEHPDADIVIEGQNRGGFIHRLAVQYRTVEEGAIVSKQGYIYLVENPLADKSTEDVERRQAERFKVNKGGFFDTVAAVKITGVKQRTVFPQIINVTTRQGIGFRGSLNENDVLLFSRDGKAFLNGADVTGQCYYFSGALFNEDVFSPGDPNHTFVLVEPHGSLQRNYPRPVITPLTELTMPDLPLGESQWRFSVREGVFDGDGFDECVFALPKNPITLQTFPVSGKVQLQWQEHEPFAVSVLVPDAMQSLDDALEDVDLLAWIRAGLERFRAAGIRLNVEYYSEQWVLDHSILRDASALTGSGIFYDGTIL
jgi:hypothetical protein